MTLTSLKSVINGVRSGSASMVHYIYIQLAVHDIKSGSATIVQLYSNSWLKIRIRIRNHGSLYIYPAVHDIKSGSGFRKNVSISTSSSWHIIWIRNHGSIYTAVHGIKSVSVFRNRGSISTAIHDKIRIRILQPWFILYTVYIK